MAKDLGVPARHYVGRDADFCDSVSGQSTRQTGGSVRYQVKMNGSSSLGLPFKHREHAFAEVRQVVGPAAADVVSVDHNGRVFPQPAGVDEIVLDARRAGDSDATIDAGRDRYPGAVADGGDELSYCVKVADELQHVW